MIKHTFLEAPESSFEEAEVIVIPIPYAAMTSNDAGTRMGPEAIITASGQLEWYDEELKLEIPSLIKIFTTEIIEPDKSSPAGMVKKVEDVIGKVLDAKKIPAMLGGDHSLSIGSLKALGRRYPNAGILHLDAHSDLRETWEESEFSHACSMRHALAYGLKLVQVGVRSTTREIEEELSKDLVGRRKVFFAPHISADSIIKELPDEVYISIDFDAFDPSIMPAVGTPEPGGLAWYAVLNLLKLVAEKRRVLGFDAVELMPLPGIGYPQVTAARLIAKLIGYIGVSREK